MDAPHSRRALLATGVAVSASATAGCIGEILPGDDSSDEHTVAGLGIGNRLDEPIEVSALLRLEGEVEFWETVELAATEPERDHLVDGPWEVAPGDLEVWARYRPVEDAVETPGLRLFEYTFEGDYEGCVSLSTVVTDMYGIETFAGPPHVGVPEGCPPISEW